MSDDVLDAEPVNPPPGGVPDRKPCPMCGEMIAATAKKCRFCGHYFDPSLRPKVSTTDGLLMPVDVPVTAIAAGYLGLLSVLLVFAPVSLIVSIFALRTLKKSPEMSGRGRAWFGLIMGIVFTLMLGVMVVALMSSDGSRGPYGAQQQHRTFRR